MFISYAVWEFAERIKREFITPESKLTEYQASM